MNIPTTVNALVAHTTHFSSPGWNYLPHGFGSGKLPAGGSYVSLTKGNDLTIVIETMVSFECQFIEHSVTLQFVKIDHTLFLHLNLQSEGDIFEYQHFLTKYFCFFEQ